MAWEFLTVFGFLLALSGAAAYAVAAGWIPWTYPTALLVISFVVAGFFARRNRGTQPVAAGRPNPLPGEAVEPDSEAGRKAADLPP